MKVMSVRGGISSDWQWYGMRRDLCFALIRKEAMSGEGENRWRRGTFIHLNKSVRG